MAINTSKIHKLKNIAIRTAVVVIAYIFLYNQLIKHGKLTDLWDSFLFQFDEGKNLLPVMLVILLMGVNWSTEALKWRLLINKYERISFFRSLKAIFTGISVGLFTPNRLGEFLGRSFVLDRSHPWKVFFVTLIGSYSQLLVTVILGASGLLVFTSRYTSFSTGIDYLNFLIIFFAILAVLFLVLLYFNIDVLDKYFGPWLRKKKPAFASYFHVIAEYSTRELFYVLLFSILRYAIFSLQFFLLLRFFNLAITLGDSLIFTSVIWLVMAMIPTIALSEIGVRGSVALFFFTFYFPGQALDNSSTLAIVSTTSMLWFINLIIPAFLGTFFVYHLKVFRNSKTIKP